MILAQGTGIFDRKIERFLLAVTDDAFLQLRSCPKIFQHPHFENVHYDFRIHPVLHSDQGFLQQIVEVSGLDGIVDGCIGQVVQIRRVGVQVDIRLHFGKVGDFAAVLQEAKSVILDATQISRFCEWQERRFQGMVRVFDVLHEKHPFSMFTRKYFYQSILFPVFSDR